MLEETIDGALRVWYARMQELEEAQRSGTAAEIALALRAVGNAHETVLRELRGSIERARLAIRAQANQVEMALEARDERLWARLDEASELINQLEQRIIDLERAVGQEESA